MSAYLILLISDMFLHISPVRRFFNLEEDTEGDNSFIIYNFIILGVAFWIIDAIIDYLYFYNLPFFDLLLFDIPAHKMFVRTIVFVISIISGLIIYKIISDKKITEEKYIQELKAKKEELSSANQQLTAYNEEIMAMNEELDESMGEINEFNKRFVNMINIVSNLESVSKSHDTRGEYFLAELLQTSVKIVPEADYGAIHIKENGEFEFIDTIGHNFDILRGKRLDKDIFYHSEEKEICSKNGYSIDIDRMPPEKKNFFRRH